jgi:hypothetical protein
MGEPDSERSKQIQETEQTQLAQCNGLAYIAVGCTVNIHALLTRASDVADQDRISWNITARPPVVHNVMCVARPL